MSSLGHSHGSEALGFCSQLCSNTHPLRTSSVLYILDLGLCSAINFQVLVQFPIMLNFIYRRFFPTFNPPKPLGSCQHNYHPIHFKPFHCQTLSLKKRGELSKYQRPKHQVRCRHSDGRDKEVLPLGPLWSQLTSPLWNPSAFF